MKKQEAIQAAYGEHWDLVASRVDENGWAKGWGYFDEEKALFMRTFKIAKKENWDNNQFHFRPKSLVGIEDNNGWTKIESEADLPKDLIECYVYDDDGDVGYYTFGLNNEEADCIKENGITHYQPIIKPNPPVY